METKTTLEFGILDLVEDLSTINYNANFAEINKAEIEFQFEHNIEVKLSPESIIVTMRVHVMHNAEELAIQGVRASFVVRPFNSFVNDIQDEGFNVTNPNVIDTFISVCIGAARGMIVKNFKGTPLDGIILPLIPMNIISANSTKRKRR